MSEKDLKQLIGNPNYYNVIRILRDGPLKEETIIKYLSTASKLNKKNAIKIIKMLEKEKLITSFLEKGINYLLIKDFYIIRIPPKKTIDSIQKKSDIPKAVRERYLINMKRFFSSYVRSTNKLKADIETNLIAILLNPESSNIISRLRDGPAKSESLKKKYSNFENIKIILLKYDIIEIFSKIDINWVFLKTDLHFKFIFPEYLIKNITENLTNKKINKVIALKALYSLKRSYLENKKPEMFEVLKNRIQNKLELAQSLEKKGEKPIDKAKDLKKLYKTIGDYDNKKLWEKKLSEWQEVK